MDSDLADLRAGPDGRARCWWCLGTPEYMAYHDEEWGRPSRDERHLFELLTLEAFQSGLSWLTILRKREAFRRAFAGFDYRVVARFGPRDVERLLADASIVRHRGKIESTINNASRMLELVESEGSLASFVWRFEPPAAARPRRMTREALLELGQTDASRAAAGPTQRARSATRMRRASLPRRRAPRRAARC